VEPVKIVSGIVARRLDNGSSILSYWHDDETNDFALIDTKVLEALCCQFKDTPTLLSTTLSKLESSNNINIVANQVGDIVTDQITVVYRVPSLKDVFSPAVSAWPVILIPTEVEGGTTLYVYDAKKINWQKIIKVEPTFDGYAYNDFLSIKKDTNELSRYTASSDHCNMTKEDHDRLVTAAVSFAENVL